MRNSGSKPVFYLLSTLVAVLVTAAAASAGAGTFLGIQLTELTPELRRHFAVPEDLGVMVARVLPDTPAERAGVAVGDIVTRVAGEDIGGSRALVEAIRQRADGEVVTLEVWRDDRIETLEATLGVRADTAPTARRRVVVRGGHEGEGCGAHLGDFDCGAERCEVKVRCDGEDCECTVNGEAVDCASLPHHGEHGAHHGKHGAHHGKHGEHHGEGSEHCPHHQ